MDQPAVDYRLKVGHRPSETWDVDTEVKERDSIRALTELASAESAEEGLRAFETAWSALGGELPTYKPLLVQLLKRLSQLEQLKQLAGCDPLTGVGNRRAFEGALERELIRQHRNDCPISVILLDMDGLKPLNDQLGHAAGDAAIIAMARSCEDSLRGSDVLARLGGDEFAILLPETDRQGAARVARRLRQDVECQRVFGVQLRTSLGIATATTPGGGAAEILAEADAALYRDKRERRERQASWIETSTVEEHGKDASSEAA